jgi:hypothetical protein
MRLGIGKIGSRSLNKVIEALEGGVNSDIAELQGYGPDDYIPVATPVNAVAATGTLVIAEPVTANDTITIGSVAYTFVAGATAEAGKIGLGAGEAATKLAIVAAINGTDTFNTAHPQVTAVAFSGDNCVLTAKVKGVAGNSIGTTSSLAHASNKFNAVTLVTGKDGTVGGKGQMAMDNDSLYVCINNNTITDTNWRKISLGSVY